MNITFLLALTVVLAYGESYTFVQCDYPGATGTAALRINNSGQILGLYTDASRVSHCFLRSPDGTTYTAIRDPPGAIPGSTTCSGLNNLGQITGSFRDAQGFHVFVRSAAGGFTTFELPASFGPDGNAADINDRGEIVGIISPLVYGGIGFLRNAAGDLITLKADSLGEIAPVAINNQGQIAGSVLNGSSQGTQHGFFRSPDGVYTKFDLPGTTSYSRIYALNNAGRFAGELVGGPGFVSNPDGSFTLLDGYQVNGINDIGIIVGSRYDSNIVLHGFVGTPGTGSKEPAIRTALPGVLSAAAFGGARTIAPGSWIEIYGQNLASMTRQWSASDFQGDKAPTSLDGITVSIGGVQAFVSYISPGQVNALVPSAVAAGTATVTVSNGSQTTAPYSVSVREFQPAMLSLSPTFDPNGAYVVALFPDFKTYTLPSYINVPQRRPKPGDTITLFGAGFGPVIPAIPTGRIATQPASLTASVQITFSRSTGPVAGKVTYAGLVPGSVGLYQFNVVLPNVPLFADEDFDDYVSVNVTADGIPALGRQRLFVSMSK